MKKFMFTNVMVLIVLVLSSFSFTDVNVDNKDVLGTWNYTIPNAPEGYQVGQLVLEEKEDVLSGYTLTGDFKTVIESVKLNEKHLTFALYVENTDVSFNLNFDKDKFKGTVSYSEGTLDITGEKKE